MPRVRDLLRTRRERRRRRGIRQSCNALTAASRAACSARAVSGRASATRGGRRHRPSRSARPPRSGGALGQRFGVIGHQLHLADADRV